MHMLKYTKCEDWSLTITNSGIMVHTKMPQNCTVFLIRRELTLQAIFTQWQIVLVRKIKGKPRNKLRGSLYSTFKTSF